MWLTASRWMSAPRRPRRVVKPSASMRTTASKSSRVERAIRPGAAQPLEQRRPRASPARRPRRRSAAPARRAAARGIVERDRARRGARCRAAPRIRPARRATAETAGPWACRRRRGRSGRRAAGRSAIERGEPSWQTRSTSPMSMPSSSDAVATSTFSSPRFSRCSAASRCSFARLPWCAATRSSPSRSDRWRATRSAMRRVLTKTSVVRCCVDQLGEARRRPASTLRSTSPLRAATAALRARRSRWR